MKLQHLSIMARDICLVSDVSFSIARGETVCLVGESGCGKSLTAKAIMRLLGSALSMQGSIDISGVLGKNVTMVFQEPMTALNPVMRVDTQIGESLIVHMQLTRTQVQARVAELAHLVGLPERCLKSYPHELSGGQRQRVMIAAALACSPDFVIADEPTTALDTTVQAQILELFADLKRKTGMGILFITHDLGVVAQIADRVLVMYAGQIVEEATRDTFFATPSHPYSRALMGSMPEFVPGVYLGQGRRLQALPGKVPDMAELPAGCRFAERCSFFQSGVCEKPIPLVNGVRCVRVGELC